MVVTILAEDGAGQVWTPKKLEAHLNQYMRDGHPEIVSYKCEWITEDGMAGTGFVFLWFSSDGKSELSYHLADRSRAAVRENLTIDDAVRLLFDSIVTQLDSTVTQSEDQPDGHGDVDGVRLQG